MEEKPKLELTPVAPAEIAQEKTTELAPVETAEIVPVETAGIVPAETAEIKQKRKKLNKKEENTQINIEKLYVNKDGNLYLNLNYFESPLLPAGEVKFHGDMMTYYPRISSLEQPLTFDKYCDLRVHCNKDLLLKVFRELENHKPLFRKYVSAYLTLSNWYEIKVKSLRNHEKYNQSTEPSDSAELPGTEGYRE